MKNLLLASFLLLTNLLSAETRVYELSVLGFKFGKLVITKNVEPDSSIRYTLDASGKATILWMEFTNRTLQDVIYKSGRLISATYSEVENGKTKRWNKVHYDGQAYHVDSYSGKRSFSEAPRFSILPMYFEDVKGIKRIFYEPEAEFTAIKQLAENKYEIKTPDGNRNVYHYINGALEKAEFYLDIAIVYMKRIR